jgi:assimilatory nitrate reductase catalytic subunit
MNLKSTAEHSWSVVDRDFPTNRGGLCQKGWTATKLLEDPGQLRTPLVRDRRSEPLRAATWEDALERIACFIERTQAAHGTNAAGVFGGGSLTNEKSLSGQVCACRSQDFTD